MSAHEVGLHDKMRARYVNTVARGLQAPQPGHEFGTVSRAPPPSEGEASPSATSSSDEEEVNVELMTAPVDWRFPATNQTRHCYIRYLEFHRCVQLMGKDEPKCYEFARYYRSLCPLEWIERWNDQRARGVFPGPF